MRGNTKSPDWWREITPTGNRTAPSLLKQCYHTSRDFQTGYQQRNWEDEGARGYTKRRALCADEALYPGQHEKNKQWKPFISSTDIWRSTWRSLWVLVNNPLPLICTLNLEKCMPKICQEKVSEVLRIVPRKNMGQEICARMKLVFSLMKEGGV